ncbi:hypothetical protein NFI96_016945 [Prochilodus magdalenae]|nr:hypothetical protein NFI96_016945 [Prochilodus magdalenae]
MVKTMNSGEPSQKWLAATGAQQRLIQEVKNNPRQHPKNCRPHLPQLSDHFEMSSEIYLLGLSPVITLYFADTTRVWRTARTVKMSSVVNAYPVYEQLHERGVFSGIRRMLSRAVDIATALADNEEFRYLRDTYNEKWKPFREELNKLVNEERNIEHFLLPQVRAVGRMLLAKFGAFVDRVNAVIDDDTVMILSNAFKEDVMTLYNKYLEFRQTTDPERVDETFGAMFKVVVVGFNFMYAPLVQAWDFVLIQLIQTQ